MYFNTFFMDYEIIFRAAAQLQRRLGLLEVSNIGSPLKGVRAQPTIAHFRATNFKVLIFCY